MAYDKSVYDELNERIPDLEKCYGPSLTLYPGGSNGSRLNMATQNQKQYVTLVNPDIPRVSTGHENAFGYYSHAYKDLKNDWKVIDKICKFGDDSVYTLVMYQESTDTYTMIEKMAARYIAEKFGYGYNTAFMDGLSVGDEVNDPILYKSTSYDDHMNYRPGKNALVMYSSDISTYEDGVKIRKGFLEQLAYNEVDQTTVSINDNDILLFMHGDKAFPDVGEVVMDNDILCATRRVNSMYATYDFREQNIHRTYSTDNKYYTKLHSVVYDIDIYCNRDDEIPDTIYNAQLRKYYDYCCEYADKMYEAATKIKQSGSKYTDEVTYIRKKYKGFNDPKVKWKLKDKPFANIVIIFKTKTVTVPADGCKVVGRYGDKGVVSKICDASKDENFDAHEFDAYTRTLAQILGMNFDDLDMNKIAVVDDESMYRLEDGTPIDIVLNATGAFRRENTDQLYEVDLTFIAERHRQWICTLTDEDQKIEEIFKFIGMVNETEMETFLNMYKVKISDCDAGIVYKKDAEFRRKFIESVEKDGYYFRKPPTLKLRYEAFERIYDEYPHLCEEYQLYVDIFGMTKPVLHKAVVGYKYMYLLKQTSSKNFSARSTGTTTKAGLPSKSADKKENRILNSNTPVCISEISDLQTQLSMTTLAEHNIWTRTSMLGRRALGKIINTTGDPFKIGKLKIKSEYRNDNVVAFKAMLKVMGIGYDFVTNKSLREQEIGNIAQFITVYNYTFFDRPVNRKYYVYLIDQYNRRVRSGESPTDTSVWRDIILSTEGRFLKIPQYVIDTVRSTIYITD